MAKLPTMQEKRTPLSSNKKTILRKCKRTPLPSEKTTAPSCKNKTPLPGTGSFQMPAMRSKGKIPSPLWAGLEELLDNDVMVQEKSPKPKKAQGQGKLEEVQERRKLDEWKELPGFPDFLTRERYASPYGNPTLTSLEYEAAMGLLTLVNSIPTYQVIDLTDGESSNFDNDKRGSSSFERAPNFEIIDLTSGKVVESTPSARKRKRGRPSKIGKSQQGDP